MKLSLIIPAHNEEANIGKCLEELRTTVGAKHQIPYEIICVNDNSDDATESEVRKAQQIDANIRLVTRRPPAGFGRAVRAGLDFVTGDVVIIYMADLSDDPEDAVAYYGKIMEGYDCVFGSRFRKGSHVEHYPPIKRFMNRIANRLIKLLFWTRFNDLTNAFKAYRTGVIRACGPYRASHFNITIEMSISALIRRYNIAEIPINWYGRQWGSSKLKLREMGRKYFCTLLMLFFQRLLISDDLMAEKAMERAIDDQRVDGLERHVEELERRVSRLEHGDEATELADAHMPFRAPTVPR